MKKLLLLILCALNLNSLAQTTSWSSSPPVTIQTRILSGSPQVRIIWTPSYIFSLSDSLARKANSATTLAGYGITDAYTKTASDARFLGILATAENSYKLNNQVFNFSGLADGDILQYSGGGFTWSNVHSLNWSKITSTPTTIVGYGITDAVDLTTNQTIAGIKTFSSPIRVNGVSLVTGGGGWDAVVRNSSTGELEIGLTNLWFPSQTSNSGKILSTNGSDPLWIAQSTLTAGNATLWGSQAISISGLGTNDILQYNGSAWQNVINTYTSPLIHSGGNTSIQVANVSQGGYLTAADWATFNAKQAALVSGTNIKTVNGTALLGSGNLAITISNTDTTSTGFATRLLLNNYATKNSPTLITPILGVASATSVNLAVGVLTTPGTGANINAGTSAYSGNAFAFRGPNGFTMVFDASSITNLRAYTGPDASGMMVLNTNTAVLTNKDLSSSTNTFPTNLTGYIQNNTTVQSLSNYNIDGLATITKATIGTTPTDALLLTNTTAATVGAQKISPSLHFNGNAWNTTGSVSESADFYNYMVPVQGTTPTANMLWTYARAGGGVTTAMTLSSAGNLTLPGTLSVTGKSNLADNIAIGSGAAANYSLLINKNATGATTIRGVYINSAIQSDVTAGYNAFEFNNTTQATAFTLGTFNGFNANFNSKGAGSSITEMNGFVVQSNLTAGTNNYAFRGKINSGTGRWNIFIDGSATNYINGSLLLGTTTDDGVNRLQVNGGIAGTTGSFTTITLSGNPTGLIGAGNALTALGSASIRWSNVHSQILTSYNYSNALGYIYQTGNMAGSDPNILASGTGGSAMGWNYSNGNAEVDFFSNNGGGANQGGYQFYDWDGTTATSLFRIHKSGFVGIGYTADPTSGNKLAVNGDSYLNGAIISSGNITIGGAINSTATPTTVNGTTSGSIVCSEPLQGSSYKKVVIYFNALFGTASYTFPVAFSNTPLLTGSSIAVSPSVTTTTASFTSAGAQTGWIILEGY